MKPLIFFDCFQTLVYKQDLAKKIRHFFNQKFDKNFSLRQIQYALALLYERRKFFHPRFVDAAERVAYYTKYNQELVAILGRTISEEVAQSLNRELRGLPFAVYADVIPTLRFLKEQGFTLGVIANWTETLKEVLKNSALEPYFSYVYSSDSLGVEKPSVGFFLKVLSLVPHAGSAMFYYVGDDYELDCQPARAAHFQPLLLDRSGRYSNAADCPKIISLRDLKKYFKYHS